MNQIFSFKRYFWLLKRQWYENAAIYTWGMVFTVLMTGLLFWLFGDWKTVDNPLLRQTQVFFISGGILLYIYAAWFFESLSSKHKRMFYFSLPVSALERVAVAFTCVIVFAPALLLIVFTVCNFISVQLFNCIHDTSIQMLFKTDSSLEADTKLLVVMLLSYLSFVSIFVLGSLLFGKKGPVISIIIAIVLSFIYSWIWKLFSIYTNNSDLVIDFIQNHVFNYFLAGCWVIMYFVMKKKQA